MILPETEIDLLKNELFIKWVQKPDQELNAYWRRWMDENPSKCELVNRTIYMLRSFELKNKYEVPAPHYNHLLDTLIQFNQVATSGSSDLYPTKKRKNTFYFVAAAASFILISIAIIGLVYRSPEVHNVNKLQAFQLLKAGYIQKIVAKGEKTIVTLPDGSRVKLNSSSELWYPNKFSDTLREVYLKGEGFFEVTKNRDAPFIVQTKEFTTRVLGTSFNIKAYEGEKENHVAVVTGKVEVNTNDGVSKTLTPDQMTVYHNNGEMIVKTKFSHDAVLGWKDGIIEFTDADFKDVIVQLSRWYGVEFKVKEGLTIEGKYVGKFYNESLSNVLTGIAYSSNFKYKIQGNEVFIYE